MKPQKIIRWKNIFIVLALTSTLWWAGSALVFAQEPATEENQACLTCHNNPDLTLTFDDGSTLDGHISGTIYDSSIHGQQGMTCAGCHPGNDTYPHPEISHSDRRDYKLTQNETCLECHPDQVELVGDSVHAVALAGGQIEAAVCIDCHDPHNTVSLHQSRVKSALACRQCHVTVYDEYDASAHGKALREENNTDVPSCGYCHGVHSIKSLRTAQSRLKSPELCGSCHADEALMSKYDISTDVFETYVTDFHGTTVAMFEKQSPDAETNKAVCYDCHGAHAIRAVDDPEAAVIKDNLLVTCQKCHPDATANFPDSWTSHFPPTFEKQPLVATVNLFYAILIPGVVGFMGLYVAIDGGKRFLSRGKKEPKAPSGVQNKEGSEE